MIEILIALLIIAFGLVSIALLQTSAIQNVFVSSQYTLAASIGQGLSEAMRANRAGVIANNYNIAAGTSPGNPTTDCAADACSPADRAQWDLAGAYQALADATGLGNAPEGPEALLPGGQMRIQCADAPCNNNSPRVINIFWDGDRTGATGLGCNANNAADLKCFRLVHIP